MPQPPLIKPITIQNLVLPQKVEMPNGVSLYAIQGAASEVVRLDILLSGGYGVQDYPLQALFTNRMLREGCAKFSATEISRRLDSCGAWLEMYSSHNCNHITLYTLHKYLDPLLEVLSSMIKEPLFPQRNLDVVCRNSKSYYKINSRKVDIVAQRHFESLLWGKEHPLGYIVRAEDYDAVTREKLIDYYSKVYSSCNATIFLSGKVDDYTVDAIAKRFGNENWGSLNKQPFVSMKEHCSETGRHNVKIDGTLQSAVRIGCMTMDSSHRDFMKMRFLTVLLGGFFGSRLMSNIREDKGYTYHIQAELDAFANKNAFMISTEAANEYIEPLIAEVYGEIERLRNEPVSSEELELVRNYTMGELCREYEGIMAKSEVLINAWLSGDGFDSVNRYIDTVRSVTSEELIDIARNYLDVGAMSEVVVGA